MIRKSRSSFAEERREEIFFGRARRIDEALINGVTLFPFFSVAWYTRRNCFDDINVDRRRVVWQQMGKVSMAVRSAAMSYIEPWLATILGR